jgi:hypothetical protein
MGRLLDAWSCKGDANGGRGNGYFARDFKDLAYLGRKKSPCVSIWRLVV